MLNQHDDHSSDNPANQEERNEPSYEQILASLSDEQQEVIEEHILGLIEQAKRPLKKLKALQLQVDAIQKEQEILNMLTWGKTETELNAKFAELYNKRANLEEQIRTIILNTK